MQRIIAILGIARSLLRVPTYLLLLMYLVIGYLAGFLTAGTLPQPDLAFLQTVVLLIGCALLTALWYIAGSGLNDYADYEIDRINLKGDTERPLVVGTATRGALLRVSLGCMAIALAIAALVSWQQFVLTFILALLSASYSLPPLQISRRGGLAPLLLPLGYIILPFYSGFMLSSHEYLNRAVLLLVIAYYLHFMGRIILKDYRDVKGDAANGKRTFLLRHGNRAVCIVSAAAVTTSSALIMSTLWDHMHWLRYGITFFTLFGITTLVELSRTTQWQNQKPLLASFGRSMTGISTVTIVALINAIWHLSSLAELALSVAIIVVYAWSARQAFIYNQLLTNTSHAPTKNT